MKIKLIAIALLSSVVGVANEKLIGLMPSEKGITFQVASSGCTKKEHFEVLITESFPPGISLQRMVEDPCDSVVPFGVPIFYSYKEMGLNLGDRYILRNSLLAERISN